MVKTKKAKATLSTAGEIASLPKGVKVIPAPKNAVIAKMLTETDIETSGGLRTRMCKASQSIPVSSDDAIGLPRG